MKKYVLYSAIIGAYDDIVQPLVVDEDFDYIIFSDSIKEEKVGVWQIRQIDYTNPIQTKVARYVKTHPHLLLPEYKCSVWIDASVIIKSDYLYNRAKSLYADKVAISSMKHPNRDCIYDEAVAVVMYNFESEETVLRWIDYLHQNHYPEHNGLCETGILFRSHDDVISRFNEEWWHCIEKYSRRDQLSFNYALWKNQVKCDFIFSKDVNIRNSTHISLLNHSQAPNRDAYSSTNKPALIRVLDFYPQYDAEIRNTYSRAFHSAHPRWIIAKEIIHLYPRYWISSTFKNVKRNIKKIVCCKQ